ncbi:ribosomal maturation YjgA family protein [Mucilaginibacter auburnensis]|uniref:Uncharacterized protein DUF2809 n=1 Tax=Mucilaginibacter auburnensis TaxID=1457233 RepID=A0A2H9VUT7_9SPHI|nr:DUF2809 domain-containing protein [Mucilaginibacter auburnensis]PJJ84568.1 uncharacterized protein DUF2809 [Mucilaginibacter auburnensis]
MYFNIRYFLLSVILFLTEAYIATYVHDAFIRPFFGDLLVVILIYCAVKAFINMPVVKVTLLVLAFAYSIELSQYFHIVQTLGLEHSKIATTIIGSYFSFIDILMYTAGAVAIIATEKTAQKLKRHETVTEQQA